MLGVELLESRDCPSVVAPPPVDLNGIPVPDQPILRIPSIARTAQNQALLITQGVVNSLQPLGSEANPELLPPPTVDTSLAAWIEANKSNIMLAQPQFPGFWQAAAIRGMVESGVYAPELLPPPTVVP